MTSSDQRTNSTANPASISMTERLSRLPQNRRQALLSRLRCQDSGESVALRHVDRGARPAASYQQEQMWFIDQLGEGRARNNIALRIDFSGEPDVPALEAALRVITEAHRPLRTRLAQDGAHVVTELADADLVLEQIDSEDDEQAVQDACEAFAARPFDLSGQSPVRAGLLRRGDGGATLVWSVHHVAWDPGSTRVFVESLGAAYTAAVEGHAPALPVGDIDYADYAHWQRTRLESGQRANELADGWRRYLLDATPSEVLPDLPRTVEGRGDGQGLHQMVDRATAEHLRRLAEDESASFSTVQLAAFAVLLSAWTNSDDVVVGTAAMSRPGVMDLIGCFVNMVPLRVQVDPAMTFRELVHRADDSTTEAYRLGELPFERIVEAVAPTRDASRHPIFQIEFTSLGVWTGYRGEAGGIGYDVTQLHDSSAKFDLSMLVGESDDGELDLYLEYDTSLYTPAMAQLLLTDFGRVLEWLAVHPDAALRDLRRSAKTADVVARSISSLALIEEAWGTTITATFGRIVAAAPDAVAIAGARPVTYTELDRWSSDIAAQLRTAGTIPGDRVAVSLGRDASAIASVLGVLKTGAAYVPIAIDTPTARRDTILDIAEVRVVLSSGLADPGDRVIVEPVALEEQPTSSELAPGLDRPESVAYVLFTSGTSGTPKGVVVENRSVVHFIKAINDAYQIARGDRVLHFAPLTFDASVFDLFAPLLVGATIVIADDDQRRDPQELQKLLHDEHVTVAEIPPALLPRLDPDGLPELRLVSVGGEAFDGTLVEQWVGPSRRFMNGYGPTECTVAVTLKDCVGRYASNPPIGLPMAGHQTLVLDSDRLPVPDGVPGQLYIAGPGVARGYLGADEATSAAFFANPWANGPATDRLYATGDLVRRRADGDLEFLGRVDRQLKIRGFRIEPGEVEAVLTSLPTLSQAHVTTYRRDRSDPVLVAYVVAEHGEQPDPEQVRRDAALALPPYMVPIVIVLEELPLTASGKIAEKSLPAPGSGATAGRAVTPPRDSVERRLYDEVFAPLLGWDLPDVEADFFALGGTSLGATNVVAQARSVFGVEIPLAGFFSQPTVAGLATLVRAAVEEAQAEQRRISDTLACIESMTDTEAAAMLASLTGDGGR